MLKKCVFISKVRLACTSFVNSFFAAAKLHLFLLFTPQPTWFFFHNLNTLSRLFFSSKIVSFMLAQQRVLFVCWVILMLPRTREKIDERLTSAATAAANTATLNNQPTKWFVRASEASVLAYLLLQYSFVWRKCPQVDVNHGREVIYYCLHQTASRV